MTTSWVEFLAGAARCTCMCSSSSLQYTWKYYAINHACAHRRYVAPCKAVWAVYVTREYSSSFSAVSVELELSILGCR